MSEQKWLLWIFMESKYCPQNSKNGSVFRKRGPLLLHTYYYDESVNETNSSISNGLFS